MGDDEHLVHRRWHIYNMFVFAFDGLETMATTLKDKTMPKIGLEQQPR